MLPPQRFPKRRARYRHARSDLLNEYMSELTRVYETKPLNTWQSIEQKFEAAEVWSSRMIARGVEGMEGLETRTGEQLQREFVEIQKESNGRGGLVVGAVVIAVLFCIFWGCRGIIDGKCDRCLGISPSHRRQRKKLSGSHIL